MAAGTATRTSLFENTCISYDECAKGMSKPLLKQIKFLASANR